MQWLLIHIFVSNKSSFEEEGDHIVIIIIILSTFCVGIFILVSYREGKGRMLCSQKLSMSNGTILLCLGSKS